MNRKEIQKEITTLRNNFKNTFLDVEEILDIPLKEITRDDYVRITVDHDVANRLNKEELNLIGGFAEAKAGVLSELSKVEFPKILIIDVETLPIEGYVWSLWTNNLSLNQIKEDWSILSYAAKWYKKDEIFYKDVRNQENKRDDKEICEELHKLLDEAEWVMTQNGKSFDLPKIRARMIINGLKPFSSVKHIDTKIIASREFGFTSNKLEYMTHKLCTNSKKVINRKFNGMELWTECLKGNQEAFEDMEIYNKGDITSLEELAEKLIPWSSISLNINLNHSHSHNVCFCGSVSFKKAGFYDTSVSRFQKYQCIECGAETRDRKNLLKKDKSKKLRITTQK